MGSLFWLISLLVVVCVVHSFLWRLEMSVSREMDKIVIIGSPGAGKTTLAQQLGKALTIQVFHLDRYFWHCGWKEYSREERVEIQQKLADGEQWIMEGSYISSSDSRLNAADTIIFLDTPFPLCLWRVIKRHHLASHKPERPDIPQGCTDRLRLVYLLKVLVFPYRGRNLLRKKIHEQRQNKHKDIYILRSNKQIQDFLHGRVAARQGCQENTKQFDEKNPLKPFLERRDLVTPLA